MSVLRVTKHGEKVLKTACPPEDFAALEPRLPALLKDMWDTMYAARGVGLAAPQIGVTARVAVVDCKPEGKSRRITLINPEIVRLEGELRDEEGCLSLPGVYSKLKRARRAVVRALDEKGRPFEVEGEGLLARAFQHEVDHLDGRLFIDRIPFEERLPVLDAVKQARPNWD
jgi:peptide deformylase